MDLLTQAGYTFETRTSGFPEVSLEDPKGTVTINARGKALVVARNEPNSVVLAADTVVYSRGLPEGVKVLGQAKSGPDVMRMLESLQGSLHEVHSGVAVARGEIITVRHSATSVRMRSIGERELEAYEALGEGVGKAGGYAIQGRAAAFVEWVGGDYTNVVGLPLTLTVRMLEEHGMYWYS